jgi:uncharacterized protein
MSTLLWRSEELSSAEVCRLSAARTGYQLAGTVLLPLDGQPAEVRYRILLDQQWHTRTVAVSLRTGGRWRRLSLSAEGTGGWLVNGSPKPALDGCPDVDLAVTPATNTLPIRRLPIGIGETARVRAAWVRFPELTVEVLEQSYERLVERQWRYRAGEFTADLTVDSAGLVLRYGNIWEAVAHSFPDERRSSRARPRGLVQPG